MINSTVALVANKIIILKPSGILDMGNANELYFEIKNILTRNNETNIILLNFEQITFINSSGIGILAKILKEIRLTQSKLYICSLIPNVKVIFELTKMNRVFDIFSTEEEFKTKIL